MIQLQHVSKAYGDGTAHPHHALRDVDLAIEDGDVFGIIGQSGTGKSTLVRCINLLDLVGLADKADRYPSKLSGGQQQRVAIARALANSPRIMLCDEATSALDTRTTVSILKLLQDINRELGVTLVVITHSLAVAERICNRVAVIDDGRIVEEGATADVFAHPRSSVTRELLEHDRLTGVSGEGEVR